MVKPEWLTIRPASTKEYQNIKDSIAVFGLNTVCVEAHCPNMSECWSAGTATVMVLGDVCTRGCKFCAVKKGAKGELLDSAEPIKLANAIRGWHLKYAVITSVCRDDLEDQGAGHFAACIREIKRLNPKVMVEVLIPDFHGDINCIKAIVDVKPDVIGHNIETVARISPTIRDRRASYLLSLDVLRTVKKLDSDMFTKSAMMLGLGETDAEVVQSMKDLRIANVDFLALGQYLRPSVNHVEVKEYVAPKNFDALQKVAKKLGFLYVASGPFVRSSYKAQEAFIKAMIGLKKR